MKIAVRNGKDGEWKRLPVGGHKEDGNIRDLIYQIPELISSESLDPDQSSAEVFIKIPSSNGAKGADGLISIDDKGKITIIECNITDNLSARREIIGRAMEYAALLWEMSYEEFNSMVLENEGKPLAELIRGHVAEEDWSEEKFKNAVSSTLNQGKFRLILTVGGLNDELRRTMKFLNARGPFSLNTYAVEMQYFSDGQIEIVVPKTIYVVESEQISSTEETSFQAHNPQTPVAKVSKTYQSLEPTIAQSKTTTKKDEKKEGLFFTKCQEVVDKNAVDIIKKLYDFSLETADDIIWWGAGGAGAFNFVLTDDGLTVFIVDANGKIMFNFSEWQRESSYKDLLPKFLEKIRGISLLRKQKEDYTRWPDFNLADFFANADDFKTFEASVKFLKQELDKMRLH